MARRIRPELLHLPPADTAEQLAGSHSEEQDADPTISVKGAPWSPRSATIGEEVYLSRRPGSALPRYDVLMAQGTPTIFDKIQEYRRTATPFVIHDLEQLDQGRPRLGILLQEPGEDADEQAPGIRIEAVTPGGPADEAGLQSDDIITHLNGTPLANEGPEQAAATLIKLLDELQDGDKVEIDYLRSAKAQHTSATIRTMGLSDITFPNYLHRSDDRRERLQVFGLPTAEGSWHLPVGWLDMELVKLNPELGEYFGTDQGVLVISVPEPHDLELKPGDVLLDIGGRQVRSPSHALRILRSYDAGEQLSVRLMRQHGEQTIKTSMPEHDHSQNFRYHLRHNLEHIN